MGREDDGSAAIHLLVEQLDDPLPVARVKLAGGLVDQENGRFTGQSPGERDPLLLAAGEFLDQLLAMVGQTDPAERRLRAVRHLGHRHPGGEQRDLDVLPCGRTGASRLPCGTSTTPAASARVRSRTGSPFTVIVPAVGTSRPAIACSRVDLPTPDGPVTARRVPGAACTETSDSTVRSP